MFKWIWNEFFKIHKTHPKIIVSDHDLALERVLDTEYKTIRHIICSWHVDQSFGKKLFLSIVNELRKAQG